MEAAARSSLQVRRSKRLISRRTAVAPQIDAAPVGIEASRRARRKRTAQIGIPYRRAKTLRQPHLARPVSNHPPDHNRDLDDSNKLQLLQPQPSPDYRGIVYPPPCPNWRRDWSDLGDGPAGLIAERVLAFDVADYLRFRAVCRPWRQSSTEPRSHSGLDRRFHPARWTMLREKLASPTSRSFLNTSTAECVKVDIPELRDHELLAVTPEEGLFVLVHKKQRATICLLNPLTHHLTELPPFTTLLPPKKHYMLLENYIHFNEHFTACSGIANDDSTVVLCVNRLHMVGMAKPGDDSWNLLEYNGDWIPSAPLMFAGRFYCVNLSGVMVLEMGADQTPQLKVVAGNLSRRVSSFADSMHLVNNCGELILVHRRCGRLTARNKSGWGYDVYRVDLDTGTLFQVKSLGGNAVFMGLYCSLSVPLDVFPSGSLRADTIYFRFDIRERNILTAGAYHLADGSVQPPCSLVPQPHTLIDCLSFSETVKE